MRKDREGKMVYQLDGHEDGVNCLAVSSDDSVLVSGSEDNTARVWSIEDEDHEEDLEDLDALFDDNKDIKQKEDAIDNESRSSAAKRSASTAKTITSNTNDDGNSSAIEQNVTEAENTLEPNTAGNMDGTETVQNSDIKNEGVSRCLGVLR